MTHPATLEVRADGWDAPIVVPQIDHAGTDTIYHLCGEDVWVNERFMLGGSAWAVRARVRLEVGGRTILFRTPQQAADALARLIDTDPELAHLIPQEPKT